MDIGESSRAGFSRSSKLIHLPESSLFSAIADQVNSLKLSVCRRVIPSSLDLTCALLQTQKEDYMSMRAAAAQYMREHPDDFLPFFVSEVNDDAMMSPEEYEKYCVTVEKTSEWGGEPEVSQT